MKTKLINGGNEMLKGIIFDMDGVLINSEPQHYEAYVRMLDKFGLTFPYEDYKGFIGSNCAKVNKYIAENFQIHLTPEQIDKEMMKERDVITETEGYVPVPGACECVKMLKEQGMKLAVASSSPMEDILAATEQLGIQKYFDELVSGSELANPKPAPDVFLKAIASIGLKPEECLIIEDSGNGVRAGKAAGCAVLAFYNPDSGNQDLSPADYVFESFEGLEFSFVNRVHQRFVGEP